MSDTIDLGFNEFDAASFVLKSTLGAIPLGGPFLSELIGSIIPNQRMDRVVNYIKVLDKKISLLPEEIIEKLKSSQTIIDLIEESFIQASRAITDERREYISNIVIQGIREEDIKAEESKYFMRLLSEISDVEIIWLRFYYNPLINSDDDFRSKHENILYPVYAPLSSDDNTFLKKSLQDSYQEHLLKLGLLMQIEWGSRKEIKYGITSLGGFLLKNIGLVSTFKFKY